MNGMKKKSMKKFLCLAVTTSSILPVTAALAADGNEHKFGIGVFGQTADYGSSENSNDYGVELTWENKMTAEQGLVSSLDTYLGRGKIDDVDLTLAGASLDLGWRFGLGRSAFMDLLGGVGYEGVRADDDNDAELTLKSIYLKPAVAVGTRLTSNNTLRLEVGVRYTVDGSLDTNVGDFDIDKGSNSYVQASWLNRSLSLPLELGLYYKASDFDFENNRLDSLERDETGVELSILF